MHRRLLTLLALLFTLPAAVPADEAKTVCVIITIREEITHNTLYLVRRGLNEALAKHADALVLDMETNGGRVDVTEEIIKLLEHSPTKTYTFVNPKAFSAGAYIAAATDAIYMSPGSVIGAATPVMVAPGGDGVQKLPESYEEKLGSAMRALIRATAQLKGHNADVFEAMVDRQLGLVIDGKTLCEKGKLLTLTNEEAAREYGTPPKPLVSAGTVDSLDGLLGKVGLTGAQIVEVKPYGFEVAARWITMVSPLLIVIGLVAIYLELKAPGLGVPTVVAVISFGLYFLSYFVAGLAGWEQAALFVTGIVLLTFEIIFPGHLLSGIAGGLLILAALLLTMTEKIPGTSWMMPAWGQLELPLAKVLLSFVGAVVLMMVLAQYLPKSSFFHKMELAATTSATAQGVALATVGAVGIAATQLRPAGTGQFGEKLVDVTTEGDLIEKGASIKVVEVEGSRVVVMRIG